MILQQLGYWLELVSAMDYNYNYERKVARAINYVKDQIGDFKPLFGITLGTGLGDLANSIDLDKEFDYGNIPNFPTTSVEGHEGKLIVGKLESVPIIGLKGRKHYYEVADAPLNNGILQTVFPIHVLAGLGVRNYFATNATGGLNLGYEVGDIMVIRTHINMLPNPLLGRYHNFTRADNEERVFRFQPMNNAYDSDLRKLLLQSCEDKNHIHEGVLISVTGPTYETEGESLAFRAGLNADAAGMSVTPEVIVARNRGLRVVAMSCITNKVTENGTNSTSHEEVKAILESAEVRDRLSSTVRNFFSLYYEFFM